MSLALKLVNGLLDEPGFQKTITRRGLEIIKAELEGNLNRPVPSICPEPIANFNRKELDHEDRHRIHEETNG